jgi:hypothetical protein
MVKTA